MKFLFLIFCCISLIGCDYYGEYLYKVENKLQKPIEVKFSRKYWYPSESRDSILTIQPNEIQLIGVTRSENLNKNENPSGVFKDNLTEFLDFQITLYSGDTINKDLTKVQYWEYSITGDKEGTYLLTVDSILLNN